MIDEEDPKEYRWETGYEKTWEAIKEDNVELLDSSTTDLILKAKRKHREKREGCTKLGMMRHLYILLDCSESMSNQDLKPNRFLCTLKILEGFIQEFFDQNPICQVGLILMHNKRAEKVSDLAGNSKKHIKQMEMLSKLSLVGEPSLQNGLELALSSLKLLPSHASREIVVIMGSLTTCDPGNIRTTIDTLKSEGVRCSVIGLSAEIYICRQLANQTGGTYSVILEDSHFKDLLYQQIDPPAAAISLESSLIKMGFPHQMAIEGAEQPLTMCMCHVDNSFDPSKLTTGGYFCPQCNSKYCELPVECRACGLMLVSAPHLARSYHHLFPATTYTEVAFENQTSSCFACQRQFVDSDKHVYHCPNCSSFFCLDCELFIHGTLHTCPGCATNFSKFQNAVSN